MTRVRSSTTFFLVIGGIRHKPTVELERGVGAERIRTEIVVAFIAGIRGWSEVSPSWELVFFCGERRRGRRGAGTGHHAAERLMWRLAAGRPLLE